MRARRVAQMALVVAAVMAFVQWAPQARAAALPGPFDPRPLMDAAAKRLTGDRYTFAVFGDSYARPPLRTLLELVDSCSPDFVVLLGDMVEDGAGKEGPKNWEMLSERVGWFLRSRPTWPVVGNHEVDTDFQQGLSSFLRFFGMKDQNYSFTFGNAKFIVLGIDPEGRLVAPDQLAFLQRELADRGKYKHVFVLRHVPFYTIGMKEKDEVPNTETDLVKVLEQSRVTATFSGHDHYYYRTRRQGVTHVIAGVSGAGVYDLQRLAEQAPGDAYMGVSAAEDQIMRHVPGRVDKSVPYQGYYESGDQCLFAVFVHVNGDRVTAETVSMNGEVWDSFVLSGDDFGAVSAPAEAPAAPGP